MNKQAGRRKSRIRRIVILLIWLAVWQLAACLVDRPIFLVGPAETLLALLKLIPTGSFWLAVGFTLLRIAEGFTLAFVLGILCGTLACFFPLFGEVLSPVVSLMKTVPVASFVILALIWAGANHLTLVVSFFVVFPILYVNTKAGLQSADPKLLEMAKVFHVRWIPRLWQIYRPAVCPYLLSACQVALGMCWKSGIAAEVIGTPSHSIGERLYMAKIYFSTDELFAWTAVVIVCSFLFEKAVLRLLGAALTVRSEGGSHAGDDSVPQ